MSNSTLKRGFTELFGTTVFRYITDKGMEWAEQLLRQGNTTVAEVANKIGYCNPGHFAAAFRCRCDRTLWLANRLHMRVVHNFGIAGY